MKNGDFSMFLSSLVSVEFFSFSLSAGFLGLIDISDEPDESPYSLMLWSFSLPRSPVGVLLVWSYISKMTLIYF